MRGDWRTTTFNQLGRIVTGKTPPTSIAGSFGGDIPFVTPRDLDGRRRIDSTERYLTIRGAEAVGSSRIPAHAVMVSCIGSDMGKAALASRECVTNQQINSIIVESGVDALFVYYNLSTRKAEIRSAAGGSAQPILNKSAFSQLEILLPPIKEQTAIASILGALDDKIELNLRMNKTLESMAQALFKSWFVDFDPVRAKIEGRDPGLPEKISHFFPDEFEESALGEIPKGWEVASIKDRTSSIQYGLSQSASESPIGPRFLRITDIRGGRVDWCNVPYCQVGDSDLEKYRVKDGDIFVARTGASTGENTYIVEPPLAVFASYLVRFQFAECGITRFVAEFMRSESYSSFVKGSIGGSAQPNASAQTLASASIAFPMSSVATRFYEITRPLDIKRAANARQSESLAALRDALLPKLISGGLRLADAERIVGRML
jgi:type I restriction enzyme, S subunit